ncbi:MAG: S-adenosylmethionine:tRNA ribosyltransferase-isomerase, partial [Rectinema sp.]|nr:S-adenosylmethionine:tRNA ribosyltransferase-isomerase [Rectinema sp.]
MKTEDFNFELPESLIAQYPPEVRGLSRLMVLDRGTGAITDSVVADIASFVEPGTLMVFNDSKVRKARIYGICEQTGAKVEFVFLAPKGDYPASMDGAATTQKSTIYPADTLPNASKVWETVCSKAKRQRFGRTYIFPGDVRGRVIREADGNKLIEFSETLDESYFERHGHVPLPPYIKRGDTADDEIRYQTI